SKMNQSAFKSNNTGMNLKKKIPRRPRESKHPLNSRCDYKLKELLKRFLGLPRDFLLFVLAISIFSFAQGILDSTLNNFLYDNFRPTPEQRGFLEFYREMPGFLVIFMSALLFFLCNRRLAAF